MTPADHNAIRARLAAAKNAPPCRLCGKTMTVGSQTFAAVTWACPGGDWRTGRWTPFDDTPERRLADEHYGHSQTTVRSYDPDLAALLAENEELRRERDQIARQADRQFNHICEIIDASGVAGVTAMERIGNLAGERDEARRIVALARSYVACSEHETTDGCIETEVQAEIDAYEALKHALEEMK